MQALTWGSKDNLESNLIPRFLTIETGQGGGPRSTGHYKQPSGAGLGPKNITSVLSEFKLRQLELIQSIASLRWDLKESKGTVALFS